jgi:hypothetical protein
MPMDRLTTTIKRPRLAEIIAGTKKIEYREVKPYWRDRLAQVKLPFELRLINGMQQRAPEVTVLIHKVKKDARNGVYELHINKVISFTNWDRSRSVPR